VLVRALGREVLQRRDVKRAELLVPRAHQLRVELERGVDLRSRFPELPRRGEVRGVLFRVVKSQAADREIDDFMTVPRSRPGRREARPVARTSRPSH
jgi:hypothetical protein